MNDLIEQAKSIARRGLPVLPCLPDKRPACEHGLLEATTDLGRIPRLFRSAALIGVRTGVIEFEVFLINTNGVMRGALGFPLFGGAFGW